MQSFLEKTVLIELHAHKVWEMHAHVAAEEGPGGDTPRQSGGIEHPRQYEPERQMSHSHLARCSTEVGLTA